jgi:hypothetical protein
VFPLVLNVKDLLGEDIHVTFKAALSLQREAGPQP